MDIPCCSPCSTLGRERVLVNDMMLPLTVDGSLAISPHCSKSEKVVVSDLGIVLWGWWSPSSSPWIEVIDKLRWTRGPVTSTWEEKIDSVRGIVFAFDSILDSMRFLDGRIVVRKRWLCWRNVGMLQKGNCGLLLLCNSGDQPLYIHIWTHPVKLETAIHYDLNTSQNFLKLKPVKILRYTIVNPRFSFHHDTF